MAKTNEEKILESLKSIEEWALAGVSQKDMAEMLGMAYSSFRDLKKKIPALSALLKKSADALKKERKNQVKNVERSLYERCLGYNAKVKKHMKVKRPVRDADGKIELDENGKVISEEVLEEVTEEQHIPADVTAMKFFLMNNAKNDWNNDPERLELEKKRVANDTMRTKLAENTASGEKGGKTIEQILEEANQEAAGLAAVPDEEGAADA